MNRPLLALLPLLAACASAPPQPDVAPMPAYLEGEVPCRYEVIERVRIRRQSLNPAMSSAEILQRYREEYCKAAARVGAEAVIVPELSMTGTARRREVSGPSMPTPDTGPPPAQAIRIFPGSCGS